MVKTLRRFSAAVRERLATSPSAPCWRQVASGPLEGLEFFLPVGNGRSWADRVVAGTYEPELVELLGTLARGSHVLYDIGAHIGVFTCAWLHLGGGGVEAFEPVPAHGDILRETVARNGFAERAHVHRVALAATTGRAPMMVNSESLGASSMAYLEGVGGIHSQSGSQRYGMAQAVEVAVAALDDYREREGLAGPAVLKVDVEGAEVDVVAGASGLLSVHRPVVICEVHNIDGGLRLADRMAALDYTLQVFAHAKERPLCVWSPRGGRLRPPEALGNCGVDGAT